MRYYNFAAFNGKPGSNLLPSTTSYVVAAGVVPMFLVPLAGVYGRRPLYIFSTILAVAANAGSGAGKTYGTIIIARVFYGVGFVCSRLATDSC